MARKVALGNREIGVTLAVVLIVIGHVPKLGAPRLPGTAPNVAMWKEAVWKTAYVEALAGKDG
jgi:hypothetical protein